MKHYILSKCKLLAIAWGILLLSGGTAAWSQVKQLRTFPSQYGITNFHNYSYLVVYKTLKNPGLYTYKDNLVTENPNIGNFALNPNGTSIAFIQKNNIKVYSYLEKETELFSIGGSKTQVPLALAYSVDARRFIASYSNGRIIFYDLPKYLPRDTIKTNTPANELIMSPNNYFVVSLSEKKADVWNIETKALRTSLSFDSKANGAAFSADASMLAVTTSNKVLIYNTRNWELIQRINTDTITRYPTFNTDNKYLSYIQNDDPGIIVFYNVFKQAVEHRINESGQIGGLNFINSHSTKTLVSSRPKEMVIWDTKGLAPYYGKRLNDEVDKMMNGWIKMMDGESMADYQIRVNDSTRIAQTEQFRQEVATGMAGNRLSLESPFAGDYDNAGGLLAINFATLPSIALPVPAGEVGDFKNPGKLKFSNAVYALRDNDEFELVYVEVKNELNDKVYIYDQIGRTKLTSMETDLNFVPLNILQQAAAEEVKLAETKEEIVAADKQDKLITENTLINVDTKVIPDVDANGNKILNYQVGYKYEVINKEFSAKEDFPSGVYDIQKSNAALSLMKIIKQSFEEGDFAKYLTEGKRVKVTITGTADGAPINGKIRYDGRYGEFTDESYYNNGELQAMTVTPATGITTNPQLAFIRAASVENYLTKNISTLQNTKNDFTYNVEVSQERGGEYRKVLIQFLIIDAFKQK